VARSAQAYADEDAGREERFQDEIRQQVQVGEEAQASAPGSTQASSWSNASWYGRFGTDAAGVDAARVRYSQVQHCRAGCIRKARDRQGSARCGVHGCANDT